MQNVKSVKSFIKRVMFKSRIPRRGILVCSFLSQLRKSLSM